MEIDPIDALRSHPHPPPELEDRVVTAVRSAGGMRSRPSPGRMWFIAVAATAIFAAGVGAGRTWLMPTTDAPAGRTRYLLLLAGDVAPAANGSSRSEEYSDWARTVHAAGVTIRGAELSPVAKLVGAEGSATAARDLTALESVGGYFIVEVETEADAVRLAESCPHVKYGGAIQIRKLL